MRQGPYFPAHCESSPYDTPANVWYFFLENRSKMRFYPQIDWLILNFEIIFFLSHHFALYKLRAFIFLVIKYMRKTCRVRVLALAMQKKPFFSFASKFFNHYKKSHLAAIFQLKMIILRDIGISLYFINFLLPFKPFCGFIFVRDEILRKNLVK